MVSERRGETKHTFRLVFRLPTMSDVADLSFRDRSLWEYKNRVLDDANAPSRELSPQTFAASLPAARPRVVVANGGSVLFRRVYLPVRPTQLISLFNVCKPRGVDAAGDVVSAEPLTKATTVSRCSGD